MEEAEKKWKQVQLETARAWANLDIAVEMVEENKKDLTLAQYAEVKAKIDEQQKLIQDTLMAGLAEYRLVTGKSSTDDVESETP
jgi:16S rRNA G527 N7-methylase RsmG